MIITDIKRKGKSETYHVYADDSYFALIPILGVADI